MKQHLEKATYSVNKGTRQKDRIKKEKEGEIKTEMFLLLSLFGFFFLIVTDTKCTQQCICSLPLVKLSKLQCLQNSLPVGTQCLKVVIG